MPNYFVTASIAAGCVALGLVMQPAWRAINRPHAANASSPASMAYYNSRRDYFELYGTPSANIVMFGDSLVESVHWNELLGCSDIVNRGIGGDTTANMLGRIDQVLALHPKTVVIITGINDASRDFPVAQSAQNLSRIVSRLHDSRVILSYVLPSASWWRGGTANQNIASLNDAIEKLPPEKIDIRDKVTKDGALMDHLTYDGVHWTAPMLAMMRSALLPLISPCRAGG